MPEQTFDTSQILGKPFGRLFQMHGERELSVDVTNRTVSDIVLSTEDPIYHWFGYIILDHSPTSIRLDRMKASGAALWCHDRKMHVGRWGDFPIRDDRKLTANTKFSRSVLGEEKFQDVQDDILCTTSVGFSMYALTPEIDPNNSERQMYIDDIPVFRSYDWEPFEASWEPVPADIGAGTNRSLEDLVSEDQRKKAAELLQSALERHSTKEENNTMPDPIIDKPETVVETRTAEQVFADNRLAAARTLRGWAEVMPTRTALIDQYLDSVPVTEIPNEAALRTFLTANETPSTTVDAPAPAALAERNGAGKTSIELARTLPRHKAITAFDRGSKDENANAAFRFGSFMLATVLRKYGDFTRSMQICKDYGILNADSIRALSEGVNSKGGFLVPVEFGNDLIDLRLKYGVFRRNAHLVQMSSDTRTDPRRVSGLTTAFVNESQLIPESDMTWDRVTLVAKKLAAFAVFSSELDEDAVIDIGNTLANEIAYAFAKKEDECGFIGDGSSTYGGIVGILPTLRALDATIGNVSGIKVGTGNAFSELVLQDFLDTMGLMPDYVDGSGDDAKWYVNKAFYFNVMAKLMLAGGGVTASEIEDRRAQRFLGYPVEFVNVLNKVEGNSVAVGLFGDLSKAATMGVRRDTTIQESEHVRFQYDDIVIKGTERFDINVHSVGNATSVAADKQPGPMVALYTAAA